MSTCLDRFPTALREYDFVSAEPSSSAVTPSGRIAATGVDVRRFPWIRPLAGDYAYDFAKVHDLYAGNPLDDAAWRDAVQRAQQHPSNQVVREKDEHDRAAHPQHHEGADRLLDAETRNERRRESGEEDRARRQEAQLEQQLHAERLGPACCHRFLFSRKP